MYRDRLIGGLLEEGLAVFDVSEARQVARQRDIPVKSIPLVLMRMSRAGWATRIRRGLYALSSPGVPPVHPFAIATHLVRPSAISHWSALHHHGFTEQVPRLVTAFTPRKTTTPDMRRTIKPRRQDKHAWTIEGVRYEFVTVRPRRYFGIEQVWVDEYSRIPITDRERTVLETFISPGMFGGIGEGIGILQANLASLQLDRLVQYALQTETVAVAKRLGWALEQAGTHDQWLKPLALLPSSGYHLLDPTLPRTGPRDSRWMIQNNLRAEITS